jgi:cytochrome b subunit of formate dehydrogenase
MAKPPEVSPPQPAPTTYPRFERSQRVEHAVFLTSFTILAVTGLAQKFATAPLGGAILGALGGIETARVIHRTTAVIMMAESIYHLLAVLHRTIVRRVALSMLPVLEDVKDLLRDLGFYLGLRRARSRPWRYSYVEKAEYLALVWGTLIMILTGFMMWNPIATANLLPGEAIPAAKSAHGNEALLAVLAIMLWHFYHVHIRHFNRSMFTGVLTREEMQHEHPAELEAIEAGTQPLPVPPGSSAGEGLSPRGCPAGSRAGLVARFVTFSSPPSPPSRRGRWSIRSSPRPLRQLPPSPSSRRWPESSRLPGGDGSRGCFATAAAPATGSLR